MQNITGKEAVQYCLQKLTESGIVLYHCLPVCDMSHCIFCTVKVVNDTSKLNDNTLVF